MPAIDHERIAYEELRRRINLPPMDLFYGQGVWKRARVHIKKLADLDKLERQLRNYVDRKIGINNLRNIKMGTEGNDVIENLFTVAFRVSVPHETI